MKVNLSAPINSLGYGVVGLNLLLALEQEGVEPALWPIGAVEAQTRHVATLRCCVNRQSFFDAAAPSLRVYHQFDLAQHVGRGPRCALPVFELDRFKPHELHHLRAQDLVFVPSMWAASVLVDNGIPADTIHPCPFGVDAEVFGPKPATRPGTTTVFLNVGKWEVRKGHDILVEAFAKAFSPADDVLLVMHCHNPCFQDADQMRRYNSEWERLYKMSPMGEKIRVATGRLPTQEHVASLMAAADCGVFPSRAEGWGLESAEMLAMGRHVILTDYSAHTEYATAANAMLVSVDGLEEAHDDVWFHADDPSWGGKPGRWARLGAEQVDQLVEHLRSVHRRKQEGCLDVNQAGIDSMREFTWQETARCVLSPL